jgi:hypothetical protein
MTSSVAGATAHNPMIKTEPRELTELRRRLNDVVELCVNSMSARPNLAGIVDADTIWPTEILDILGVDYGPGSDLASQPDEE